MKPENEYIRTDIVDGVTVIRERRVIGATACRRCQLIRRAIFILGGGLLIGVVGTYGPLVIELVSRIFTS